METALTILILVVAVSIFVSSILAVVVYRRARKTQDVIVNQVFKTFDTDFRDDFADFDSPEPRRVRGRTMR